MISTPMRELSQMAQKAGERTVSIFSSGMDGILAS
jgi:hypothetical protein